MMGDQTTLASGMNQYVNVVTKRTRQLLYTLSYTCTHVHTHLMISSQFFRRKSGELKVNQLNARLVIKSQSYRFSLCFP